MSFRQDFHHWLHWMLPFENLTYGAASNENFIKCQHFRFGVLRAHSTKQWFWLFDFNFVVYLTSILLSKIYLLIRGAWCIPSCVTHIMLLHECFRCPGVRVTSDHQQPQYSHNYLARGTGKHRFFTISIYGGSVSMMTLSCGMCITGLIPGLRSANERRRYFCNDVSHWLGASLESALYPIMVLNRSQRWTSDCAKNAKCYGYIVDKLPQTLVKRLFLLNIGAHVRNVWVACFDWMKSHSGVVFFTTSGGRMTRKNRRQQLLPTYNTSRPPQNGSHFADEKFKCISEV